MSSHKYIKKCFVDYCNNTSQIEPNKIFVSVPNEINIRKTWFEAVRKPVPPNISTKTSYFCCENHFDIKNDMENYSYYQFNPNTKIKMKPGVIPHKFNWPAGIQATSSGIFKVDVGQQTDQVLKNDIGLLVKPSVQSKMTFCNISKSNTSNKKVGTSDKPERGLKRKFEETDPSSSDFIPTQSDKTTDDLNSSNEAEKQLDSKNVFNVTVAIVKKNPKRYVGIPEKWLSILTTNFSPTISEHELYMCLMKIKLNDTFTRLGDQFGYSVAQVSRIFKKNIFVLEHCLKKFIFWPEMKIIKKYLPIQFRANYSNVQSIIDCFEIEIEKPTNPVKQALTWSEYKKCNTIKYLISCTPDGFINYVSKGYGGRTSDVLIVEVSDYLQILPNNSCVMADRGFKGITKFLATKNCLLVKPPTVSSKEKPTKEEVLQSKRIASLRIHIERVIRRIREFSFLKPHSVIQHQLIGYTDAVIVVACGLINMQSYLIK